MMIEIPSDADIQCADRRRCASSGSSGIQRADLIRVGYRIR
jgi:hypothetical protein